MIEELYGTLGGTEIHMLKRFRTVLKSAEVENIIEKSRFIGYTRPIQNENEALSFIEEIKTLHKSANHNVPVYVLGGNYEVQRYSDDGEPSGTAGMPILDMIKKEEIKNIVVVVTRYFGGIKLGTGGLVRAYTATAKLAIQEGILIEKNLHDLVKIRIDYHLLGKIQNSIIAEGYPIKEIIYDDAVNLYVFAKVDDTKDFINRIVDLSSGKGAVSIVKTIFLNELNGRIIESPE